MKISFDDIEKKINNGDYQFIGSGSARKVYDLGNGSVVKIAKDKRGLLQNQTENTIFTNSSSGYFAPILACSDDYKYLIMVKAEKVGNISNVLVYYKSRNIQNLMNSGKLSTDIKKNGMLTGDIRRSSSWGIIEGKPLLIDYGLTKQIFNKYYRGTIFKKLFNNNRKKK